MMNGRISDYLSSFENLILNKIKEEQIQKQLKLAKDLSNTGNTFFNLKNIPEKIVRQIYEEKYQGPRATTTFHKAQPIETVFENAPPTLFKSSDIKSTKTLPDIQTTWEAQKPQTKIGVWIGVAAVGTGLFFLLRKKKRK